MVRFKNFKIINKHWYVYGRRIKEKDSSILGMRGVEIDHYDTYTWVAKRTVYSRLINVMYRGI